MFIIDYDNTVVYVEKPKREFDINLLTEAANFLKIIMLNIKKYTFYKLLQFYS